MILGFYSHYLDGLFFIISGLVITLVALVGKYDPEKWSKGDRLNRWISRKYGEMGARILLLVIGIISIILGVLD